MCFLQVLFFNLVFLSILSYSTVLCNYCALGSVSECIGIWKESNHTIITLRQHDTIALNCYRVIAATRNDKNLNTAVVLQWKLQQFGHDLLVVTEKSPIQTGFSSIVLNLDRYDDGLIARCSSSGNETQNINVQFKQGNENIVDINNEDIKKVNITEGQMVRNEFANPVILYNTSDIKENPGVILPDDNIFDSIALEDNGTMYGGWVNKSIKLNRTIHGKTKWVVYVEPANAGSLLLYLQGIGGISCIVIVTSIIIVVCCKYCRKKNENSIENPYAEVYEVAHVQPNRYQINHLNPTPEEEHYVQIPSQNDRVVYAQLDIRKADKATPPIQDIEPYAKIIGVIRPNKKGQNVKF